MNHFPRSGCITRKDTLGRLMRRMMITYGEQVGRYYKVRDAAERFSIRGLYNPRRLLSSVKRVSVVNIVSLFCTQHIFKNMNTQGALCFFEKKYSFARVALPHMKSSR